MKNVINQLSTFLIDAFHMRNHLMQSNLMNTYCSSFTYIYIGNSNTDISMCMNG